MTKEALTLALECAERCEAIDGMYSWSATITAIKEALSSPNGEAQPAVAESHKQSTTCGEPVAWYSVEGETRRYGVGIVECAYAIGRDEVVHVVTHESVKDVAMKHLPIQRTWVDLTDEQMWNAYTGGSDIINLDYAKNILALFKEKNT